MYIKFLRVFLLLFIFSLNACGGSSSSDDDTPAAKNWNDITWDQDNWS